MNPVLDSKLLGSLFPAIEAEAFSSHRHRKSESNNAKEQAIQTQNEERRSIRSVEEKAELPNSKYEQCSLRDFVQAVSLSAKLCQSWFTVREAIEEASKHGYALTEKSANGYLSRLIEKGYFEMSGDSQTAKYRKACFSYQMDFWKEAGIEYRWL